MEKSFLGWQLCLLCLAVAQEIIHCPGWVSCMKRRAMFQPFQPGNLVSRGTLPPYKQAVRAERAASSWKSLEGRSQHVQRRLVKLKGQSAKRSMLSAQRVEGRLQSVECKEQLVELRGQSAKSSMLSAQRVEGTSQSVEYKEQHVKCLEAGGQIVECKE